MQFRIQAILASSVLLVGTFAALLQSGEAATTPRRPVVSVRPRPSATTTVRRSTLSSRRAATPVRRTTSSRRSSSTRYARQPAMGRNGAFSPAMINSKPQLMQYLRNNPRFRKTLAKHFGVSEYEILNYAQDNLQLISLKNNLRVRTYGVSKTGKIFPANQTLPKGSKVFALSDGTPVLKQICGNPVLINLLPVAKRNKVFGDVLPPGPRSARNDLLPSGTIGEGPEDGIVLTPTPVAIGAIAPNMAPALPGALGAGGAGGLAGGVGGVAGAAGGAGGFPLAAVAGAAGAAGLAGAAAGGSDSASTVPFGWFPEDTPEIPEPSAYLMFLSGAAPVFFMAFRRRRRDDDAEASNE